MPLLTPAELWKTSGRYVIPELFKLNDRQGREFVLPMTHEETVTFHAREIQSYRELPKILYHLSVKDRDEPRPRAGLIRVREFIMKDALLVRPRRRRPRGELPQALRRVQADLRALRDRGARGRRRVRDHGRQRQPGLPRAGRARARTRSSSARTATTRPISRSRAGCPRSRLFPEELEAPEEVETLGPPDDRGRLGVPRRRPGRDRQGDAGRRRRQARARTRSRRRPPERDEAARRARRELPAGGGRGDPGSLRRKRRLDRAGRRHGRGDRRRSACAKASTWSAPTATTSTCAASRPGATSRPVSPICEKFALETHVRATAGIYVYRRRSKWDTSSSSRRGSRNR